MEVGSLIAIIAGILAYFGLGVVLRVTGLLKSEDAQPLNTVLMYVALPALIFVTVQKSTLQPSLIGVVALAWVIALVGMALAWGLTRLLKLEGPTAGAFILLAVFGNTGYIGYPVASAILGDPGLARAIFYDVFGNTMAVITIGTFVVSRYGHHNVKVNPLREIVTFPPFIALAAALALHSVSIPLVVTDWLAALGKLVVPVVMISVGLTLKPRAIRTQLGKSLAAASLKLVVLPLIAFGIGLVLFADDVSLRIGVLQAGVPSMMLTMIMGMRFKLDVDFIASTILLTMIGGVITIPVWQLLIG